jgi:ParB/RepB/Spo0J family partition protein
MKVKEIQIGSIRHGEQHIRDVPDDDSIGELAESIASRGLLEPIGVMETEAGTYQLLYGDRRIKAHHRLRRDKIWAIIHAPGEQEIKATALVENLQRAQLTLQEEMDAVRYLAVEKDLSVARIAAALSKTRSWVLTRLMADGLPPHLKEPLLEGVLPVGHAEALALLADDSGQRYLVSQCIAFRWTKFQLAQMIAAWDTPGVGSVPMAVDSTGHAPLGGGTKYFYTCQICNERDEINAFDLVRVHKDGLGCRTASDRPDPASRNEYGLVRNLDKYGRQPDHRDDPAPETSPEVDPATNDLVFITKRRPGGA